MPVLVAGVDLGGTTASLALARPDGTIECESQIATESYEGPQRVLERIADGILALAAQANEKPAALGIGVPGLVDLERGTTKFLPNLPTNWRDVEAAATLTSLIGCPVKLLNDARAATLGELRFGHGRQVQTLALFTLGTGVGGGIAIDGKLRLGPFGAAGEIGHQSIIPDGPLCGCGNRGCLETLVSGPALTGEAIRLMRSGRAPILHEMVEGDISRVTPREMAAAANAGDEVLKTTITSRGEYLGIGAANVVIVIHPELVVLGGGVAEMGELILEPVRQTIKQRVGMFPTDGVRVEKSLLGEKAGLIGAIALAADALA